MEGDPRIEAFKAIGHKSRLAILEALMAGEMNVSEIENRTGITQPSLSQQLAVLRAAGLVETRRHAKAVFYRIDGEAMGQLCSFLTGIAGPAASRDNGAEAAAGSTKGAAVFARILPP
jgi:DNA-binding transcriptional ArsR family regulator